MSLVSRYELFDEWESNSPTPAQNNPPTPHSPASRQRLPDLNRPLTDNPSMATTVHPTKIARITPGVDRYVSIEDLQPPKRTLTVVSLFSGGGGLDIGLEQAGLETLACVEMDKHARATLAKNRPEWQLINGTGGAPGDIRHVDGKKLLAQINRKRGEVDVIAGGPPCQSFSNLGLKKGAADPVNGDLYAHYLRLVEQILPRAILFENVEGFAHPRNADVQAGLEAKLHDLGYRTVSGILVAADYGDPQIRKRFVMIGVRKGQPMLPAPTHFENEAKHQGFFDAETVIAGPFRPFQTVADAFRTLQTWNPERPDAVQMGISPKVVERMKRLGPGENFKALPPEMLPNCWRSGGHRGADTFGRLWLDRPSVTIRTSAYNPSKGRYIHPTEHRGLSTLEMAVLQSFPEEWRFVCAGKPSLVHIGRLIGNAVPVGLARALGLALRQALE